LIRLVNENAAPLVNTTSEALIATHTSRMYIKSKKTIKKRYISKQEYISFTQDAWTAPNVTAFMAVTAHFIDEEFELRDLRIAVPQVEDNYFYLKLLQNQLAKQFSHLYFFFLGVHSGKRLAELFHDALRKYSAVDCLNTITADNTSVNSKMARKLELQIPHFYIVTHILG
ncbi:uncharacterized protein VP01_6793g2, partial [Puccinia sorghi]